MADTFSFGFYCSFQHVRMNTFGKYHALRIAASCFIQLAGQLVFLSHQFSQVILVFIPVGNLFAGHSRFHGGLCYGHGHFGNQTRVDRFRDEVFGAETQVVYVVGFIDYIGHRFLCQVGDGVYGSQFHFFVDGCSACVECSTEDIRESDDIVYLVGIVGTSGRHQDIRTGSHGVFV